MTSEMRTDLKGGGLKAGMVVSGLRQPHVLVGRLDTGEPAAGQLLKQAGSGGTFKRVDA